MADPYSDNYAKRSAPDKTRHPAFYYSTVYGSGAHATTPYMTRIAIYNRRLHIFHRGDQDPDCHDHPWGFWTFPFVSYVEEVLNIETGRTRLVRVRAWRWSYRPATHAHRVMYSYYMKDGRKYHFLYPQDRARHSKKIVTFVVAEKPSRPWGFWKRRTGALCWDYWKDYIFKGGKDAPCR